MVPQPRITTQTIKVLAALMSRTEDGLSGAEIGRTTSLASGTLYPILFRLEEAGWVESRWETEDPHELGRPRRREQAQRSRVVEYANPPRGSGTQSSHVRTSTIRSKRARRCHREM